jgi:hypothetical protein
MKKRLGKISFAILILLPVCAQATVIDFNDHQTGTIQTGDNYDQVTLHDFAVVNMTDGNAQSVWSYDSSAFNMQNGNVSLVISIQNTSNVTISGGSVGSLQLLDYGIAYLSGGDITGSLGTFSSTAIVHIYATNFTVAPKNGNPMNGWLITGNWDDDNNSPFAIWYRTNNTPVPGSPDSQIILYTIPEPATVFLLGLGIALVQKKTLK